MQSSQCAGTAKLPDYAATARDVATGMCKEASGREVTERYPSYSCRCDRLALTKFTATVLNLVSVPVLHVYTHVYTAGMYFSRARTLAPSRTVSLVCRRHMIWILNLGLLFFLCCLGRDVEQDALKFSTGTAVSCTGSYTVLAAYF